MFINNNPVYKYLFKPLRAILRGFNCVTIYLFHESVILALKMGNQLDRLCAYHFSYIQEAVNTFPLITSIK